MATGYKIVKPDFGSYTDGPSPRLFYLPGHTIEAGHPVGLWAVPSLDDALNRIWRMHRHDHMLVLEIAYEDEDVVATAGALQLARCKAVRVVADSEPVKLNKWPTIPGQTIDLAPVVDAIPPRPFKVSRHGLEHARRTAENAARLIGDVAGADPDVVAAFALLHDAKRAAEDDSEDGARAADFARELANATFRFCGEEFHVLQLDDVQLDVLCHALAHDYPPTTTDDPTVGLSWDACRLATMGGHIPSAYLSTAAARTR